MDNLYNFNNKQRKILLDRINTLSSTEHEEIYRIISTHGVCVSKNKNGVFFNLSTMDNNIVKQICLFVDYCVSNKEQLDEYDKKLNECKMLNRFGKIENMNIKLEELVTIDQHDVPDNWSTIKLDQKSNARVMHAVQKMNEDREKLCVKKTNSKYITAKKKFSKKCITDIELLRKKFDFETCEELNCEHYIIH
jgi:hypothetical protein